MTTLSQLLKRYTTRIIVLSLFAITLIGLSNYAVSNSGGKTGRSTTGCTCHCNNSNNSTTVSITTSATVFEAGQTYNFTITVSSSDGNASNAGCNISASTGTLTAGSNGLQKIGAELTHTSPKALTASWDFTYTVPTSGTSATINAAGNAVDGSGDDDGNCSDNWNTTSYTLTIAQRGVAITRTTIPFGDRRVGTAAVSDTLRIVSTGDAALTVTSSAMKNATPFSASPTGTNRSIAAGANEVNTITFNPTSKGTFVDTFIVNNNATIAANQRKTVVVTGKAIQAIFTGAANLPFGNVNLNQTKDLVYTIQNTGDDTLFLSTANPAVITGPAFTIVSPPAVTTILPNGSTTMTVRFAPTAKQAYTGTLTFNTLNNITSPTVNVTGTGAAPQISVQSQFDLGSSKVGQPTSSPLNITNSGNAPLQINSILLGGTHAGKFSIVGSTTFTIQPTQTQPVTLSYTPNAEGRDTAQITITSNDEQSPTKIIPIYGRGVRSKMSVSPDTVDFGDVRLGSSLTRSTISISNPGEVNLVISSVTISPAVFTSVASPNQIQPASSGIVSVKFTPTVEGPATGMVIIASDAPATPLDTVYLKGKGTKSEIVFPSSVNFGSVRVDQLKDSTIKIENVGTAPVMIRKYALTDADNVFGLLDTVAHTLNPASSINVKIRFRPNSDKSFAASLVVTTDESANNTITISLSGKGIDSKLAVEPNVLNFGEIDTMKVSAPQTVTIHNTGSASTEITSITKSGSSAFAMSVDKTAPFTLLPDSSATVTVTFAPTLVQAESGTITVSASEGSPIDIELTGTGKEIPLESVARTKRNGFSLAVSPNPASERVVLTLTSERLASVSIQLVHINGTTARTLDQRVTEGVNIIRIQTSDLSQGRYFLRILENDKLLLEENVTVVR